MKNSSHLSENESNMLLSKNYENINYFNKNFICNNVQEIISLYTKSDEGLWNHPLLLNYNYCFFCGDSFQSRSQRQSLIDNHIKTNIGDFMRRKRIKFRKQSSRLSKLASRRFIKSTESKVLISNNDKKTNYDTDTELILSIKKEKTKLIHHKTVKNSKRMSFDIRNPPTPPLTTSHREKNVFDFNNRPIASLEQSNANPLMKKRSQIQNAKQSIMKIFNLFTGDKSPKEKNETDNTKIDLTNSARLNTNNEIKIESFAGTNEEKINKNELCEICLGPITDKLVINCGDFYCRNCIKDLVLSCITDISKFNSIKCPRETCKEVIDDNIIEKLLNKEEFEKYKRIKNRIKGLTDKSLIPCPYPDCDGFAEEKNVKKNIAICTLNHHLFCRNCLKILSQENENIENLYEHICEKKIDESLKYLESNKCIKKCPACHSWVQREPGGCNNMTCMNIWCGYEFCWICENMYDNSHYKNPFSVCFGLGVSDFTSKFSRYKSARVAKCIVIFLLLICVAMPILLSLFSFVIIAAYIVTFILEGSTIKGITSKVKIINNLFYGIAYTTFVFISIALIPLGYIVLALMIVGLPILCIVHRCKKEKEEEE